MNRRAPFLVAVARQTPRPRVDLELNRRLAIICLAVAAAAAALLAPLAASGDATQRLYVGMNLHLTGPNNAGVNGSGTFEIVVDATTNQLIGTEVATVHPRATLRSATTSVARAVDRCTMAVPPARATIAVEIANASDFCELFSHMLADNVFHAPVLVTPGVLWHYHGAAFSCRAHYRSTRERMTINNAPAACRWLERRATGWRLEGASEYAHAA